MDESADEENTDLANETAKVDVKTSTPSMNDLLSIIDDGCQSEGELDTRKLVFQMNRKKRKSGGFQSMGLTNVVFKGVMKKGYKVPTPIQRKCIPLLMKGKDVVAMARTGSGKTAAFLIPILEKLQTRQSMTGVRALLLSPTRELAFQTLKFLKELGRYTNLRTACILGGDKMEDQFSALHENPDIIIATPGRLMHVLVEMELKLKSVQYVVFDEADRLFELGFQEHLHEILRRLPEDRQTLLFSATLPGQLVEFAKAGLNDPTLVRLDVDSKLSDQLKLAFLHVRHEDKLAALLHLLRNVFEESEQSVVFVATMHHVEYIKEILLHCGMQCSFVYSSLDQAARKINIQKFREKETMILLVTDVAARGLDIPMLDNVVNFTYPPKSKLFVHRVGRVARAGRTGTAYSLVCPDELPYVIDLHLFLGRPMNFARTGHKYKAWDNVYGKVSQIVVDEENATLQQFSNNTDLSALHKVSANAFKQYLRSRPVAASESIKRAKEILVSTQIGVHPLYENRIDDSEKARLELINAMKSYKPTSTIFEIGTTTKSTGAIIMKQTRKRNEKIVNSFKDKLKKRQQENEEKHLMATNQTQASDIDDVDLKNAFSNIVQSSKSRKNKGGKTSFKDDNFYINYRPKDHHTEQGLSVLPHSNFTKEASNVVLDLMGDEDTQLRKQHAQKKVWDRKRKRFVNEQDAGKSFAKKKIKTESGAIISSTYKKNIYADWKHRSKQDDQEDNGEADGISKVWRGSKNHFGGRKGKPNVKSELKRPEQILKKRKIKEQNLLKQQGRRKQGRSKPEKRGFPSHGKNNRGRKNHIKKRR